jgi:negative regulator of genetic competence, sporulation and motility
VYTANPTDLEKLPELKKTTTRQSQQTWMTLKQFWQHVIDTEAEPEAPSQKRPYYYFLGAVQRAEDNTTEFSRLVKDVKPIDFFAVDNQYFMNIWFGSRGVVAQTHFDHDINFATQVRSCDCSGTRFLGMD